MEKIDYKKIIDAAIGEKPSLVKPDVLEFDLSGEKAYLHKEDFFKKDVGQIAVSKMIEHIENNRKIPWDIFIKDLPTTTEPYEYKQQGFLPFANPPRFTEE
jgi:hypothetical protein